jgi:hypothetical protein
MGELLDTIVFRTSIQTIIMHIYAGVASIHRDICLGL